MKSLMNSLTRLFSITLLLAVSVSASAHAATDCNNKGKIPVVVFTDSTNLDDVPALVVCCKGDNIDLKAIHICGTGFAEPGAGIRNVYNLIDWLNHSKTSVVIGGFYPVLEKINNATALTSTTTAAIPRNDGGLPYSSTMWGTSHLLPQSKRFYVAKDTATLETQDEFVAIREIRNVIATSPTPVTILSVGPFSGVWEVLDGADASVINNISRAVVMGGAFNVPGNLFNVPYNTTAEFNIYNDPIAANNSYNFFAANNIPVVTVPLDATDTTPLTRDFLNELRSKAKTPEAKYISLYLDRIADTWFDPTGLSGLFLWDVTAAIYLIDPSIVTSQLTNVGVSIVDSPASINIATGGGFVTITNKLPLNFGQTVLNNTANNVTVLTGFDSQKFYSKFIDLLNSKHNSARCKLLAPCGCYKERLYKFKRS